MFVVFRPQRPLTQDPSSIWVPLRKVGDAGAATEGLFAGLPPIWNEHREEPGAVTSSVGGSSKLPPWVPSNGMLFR